MLCQQNWPLSLEIKKSVKNLNGNQSEDMSKLSIVTGKDGINFTLECSSELYAATARQYSIAARKTADLQKSQYISIWQEIK